ncbi:hypothetical protein Taro_044996 [Colocasia esculenta]|uniref:Uncharacterized protein n=1 Tax=Colocasia esculenta TaxID=4460 RepID=A0A843WKS4_COLES|nr:hypothetical protein [Colocasia esculenta]
MCPRSQQFLWILNRVLDPPFHLVFGVRSVLLHRQELGVNTIDAKISHRRPAIVPSKPLNGQRLPPRKGLDKVYTLAKGLVKFWRWTSSTGNGGKGFPRFLQELRLITMPDVTVCHFVGFGQCWASRDAIVDLLRRPAMAQTFSSRRCEEETRVAVWVRYEEERRDSGFRSIAVRSSVGFLILGNGKIGDYLRIFSHLAHEELVHSTCPINVVDFLQIVDRFVAVQMQFFFPFRRALFHLGGCCLLHLPLRQM